MLERAVDGPRRRTLAALADGSARCSAALTDDLLTSEFMCRMCDELACPDERCPVERAEPAPRRTAGARLRHP